MDMAFLKVLNMSISASWLVLVVLVLRLLLKKSPRWIHVCLWALVAVRLVCPFTIESVFSLIPENTTQQMVESVSGGYYGDTMIYSQGSIEYDSAVAAGISPSVGDNGYHYVLTRADDPTKPVRTVVVLFGQIWVAGIVLMMLYAMFSYTRLKRKVSVSIDLGRGVYICDYIDAPFVLGIIRPRIYLPSSMEPDSAAHVLAHERAHITRRDHWWKPLAWLLLTIHWFNPIMWLAYILLCRDIELACDEKVVAPMPLPERKSYSDALLKCSVRRIHVAACPLAFGEVGIKERVKSVLNYKKPSFWIVIVAIIALFITAVCFLTEPVNEKKGEIPVQEIVQNGTIEALHELSWLYWAQHMCSEYDAALQYLDYGQSRTVRVCYDGDAYTISDEAGTRTYQHCVKSQGQSENGTIAEYFLLTDDPEMTAEKYLSGGIILPTEVLYIDQRTYAVAENYGEVPESMEKLMELGSVRIPRFYCQNSHFYLNYGYAMSSVRIAYGVTRVDYHGNLLCNFELNGNPQRIVELEDGGFAVYAESYADGLYELSCYDEAGNLRWCYPFEEAGRNYVTAMVQKNGDIYCFGEVTPEDSSSDIYIWRISLDGELVQKLKFGGSDFDSVYRVIETQKGFVIYGSTQSGDGDLPLSKDGFGVEFQVEVSENLELGGVRNADIGYSSMVGYHQGNPIFADDPILDVGSNDRMPEVLHYGHANIFDWEDGYVVVRTLNYEAYPYNPPAVSMMTYYNQVVMTGYDSKGNPIWQLAGDIHGG